MINFLVRKRPKIRETGWKRPIPDRLTYAIGDLHGCADLLSDILNRIDADLNARGVETAKVVFLGDYLDRGAESDLVLSNLQTLSSEFPDDVVCLKGNHEQMMLDALSHPKKYGAPWLRNGGLRTIASFGVSGVHDRSSVDEIADALNALRGALPDGQEEWLRSLPVWHRAGDVLFVHAAADPTRAPDAQVEQALIWGHSDFRVKPRRDGIWVVHGHTVVDAPEVSNGVISVDTGACFTGVLTAVALAPGEPPRFIDVGR